MCGSGPTDPSEAYFDKGLWGWDLSQWRKLSLLFGYTDRLASVASDTSLAGGTVNLDDSAVPAGEIWVVTVAAVTYLGTPPTSLDIRVVWPGVTTTVLYQGTVVTGVSYPWNGVLYLKEGDYMRARVVGSTAGDGLYLRYGGYKMAISE